MPLPSHHRAVSSIGEWTTRQPEPGILRQLTCPRFALMLLPIRDDEGMACTSLAAVPPAHWGNNAAPPALVMPGGDRGGGLWQQVKPPEWGGSLAHFA